MNVVAKLSTGLNPGFMQWHPQDGYLVYPAIDGLRSWDIITQKSKLLLPDVRYLHFDWFPDGIRFVGIGKDNEIRTLRGDGCTRLDLHEGGWSCCYTDVLNNIWIGTYHTLYVFRNDGRKLMQKSFGSYIACGPHEIAFRKTSDNQQEVALCIGSHIDTFLMNTEAPDPSMHKSWSFNVDTAVVGPGGFPGVSVGAEATSLSWDRSGTKLAVATNKGYLFVLSPEGKELSRLEVASRSASCWDHCQKRISWSADGNLIAVTFPSSTGISSSDFLSVVHLNGEQVTMPVGKAKLVAWHPMRRVLAVASDDDGYWDGIRYGTPGITILSME